MLIAALLASAGQEAASAAEEGDAVRRCEELLPHFVEHPADVAREIRTGTAEAPTGVRLSWRRGEGGQVSRGWIVCWFLPRASADGEWQILRVESDEFGVLSRYDVQQLYKFLRLRQTNPQLFADGAQADGASAGLTTSLLYFLQQTVNGISLGCLYALLAVGYTMVYGISRIVNFAFGDFYMLGAFLMLAGFGVMQALGGNLLPFAFFLILAATAATTAAYSWTSDRLAFRHMRNASLTAPLIATIGLSIFLKEYVRLTQGAKYKWLPYYPDGVPIVQWAGYDVFVSQGHLIVGAGTLLIAAALWWLSTRTTFGRRQRACAEDPRMAALLGVDVDRTIGLTFLLGGAVTGAAGLFAALQYGLVDFFMGYLIGFKALTAAVLGGIGSLPGAVLGGLLIALTECYTAGLIGSEWKDLAIFAVLVFVLLFRPAGLLGTIYPPHSGERI